MNLIHTCIALSLAAVISPASVAAQQQGQPPADARPKAPDPVTGEVVSINTDTKTIVVKTTSDSEMKFSYSPETEIVGAEKGAEGLATKTGTLVTVTYDVHGTANVAIKIEVKPKQ